MPVGIDFRGENPGRLGKTSGDRILPALPTLHPLGRRTWESSASWRDCRLQVLRTRAGRGGVGGGERDPSLMLSRNRVAGVVPRALAIQ